MNLPENSSRLLNRQFKKAFPDGTFNKEGAELFLNPGNQAYLAHEDERFVYNRV